MKKTIVVAVLAFVVAMQFSCTTGESKPPMKTFKEKYSYMIGLDIGHTFKQMNTDIDYNALVWGMKEVTQNRTPLLSAKALDSVKQEFSIMMQQAQAPMMKETGDKNLKEGEAFLAENKKKPGVVTTASGLQYMVIKAGKGPKPKLTDKVKVQYAGTLIDGKEFDSSYKRGQPAEFPVTGIIPGWSEALLLMNVGSKYKLFIPAKLAYGEHGAGPIGPNSTLIFEVELVEIVK
ncbi:MAG: FKBP-type peptidyl-prolyl cis-trans isomerase [Chitinispirillaceae bacterium]|jgi:FKBP-type peptidyl-prolyl cis-trans isomerase